MHDKRRNGAFVRRPCQPGKGRLIRLAAGTLVLSLLGTGGYAVSQAPAREPTMPAVRTVTATRTVTVQGRYRHRTARSWAHGYRRRGRLIRQERGVSTGLRRSLLSSPSVTEAINLACAVYGNCDTLWRRARCESGLDPSARNESEASGLLQFIPSTWASTPFARFSVFSPYANALAAGWMIGPAGRGSEWSCR